MLRELDGQRRADMARWGLTPAWLTDLTKTPAHARAETLADQPMFREAFRSRRCLILANGFYEWRGVRKRPYWISAEGGTLYMAGLWEAYPVGDVDISAWRWSPGRSPTCAVRWCWMNEPSASGSPPTRHRCNCSNC